MPSATKYNATPWVYPPEPKTFGFQSISGRTFTDLTPICYAGRLDGRASYWLCQCTCGSKKIIAKTSLVSGLSTSCGCKRIEKSNKACMKHGMSKHPVYKAFLTAKERCRNPKNHKFRIYGARGIEFRIPSFEAFIEHLGPRPKGMSLDRVNNDGHYELGNLRWATPKQQSNNRRIKKRVKANHGN